MKHSTTPTKVTRGDGSTYWLFKGHKISRCAPYACHKWQIDIPDGQVAPPPARFSSLKQAVARIEREDGAGSF